MIEGTAKLLRLIASPKGAADASLYAMATLANALLRFVDRGWAQPFAMIARQYWRRIKARTQSEEIDVQKRTIEAVLAANEANAQYELRKAQIKREHLANKQTELEIQAKELQNTEQTVRLALATEQLGAALARFNSEGGKLYFDPKNLQALSNLGPAKQGRRSPTKDV